MKIDYPTLNYFFLLHLLVNSALKINVHHQLAFTPIPYVGGGSEMNSFGDTQVSKKGEEGNNLVETYQMFVLFFFFRTVESTLIFAGYGHFAEIRIFRSSGNWRVSLMGVAPEMFLLIKCRKSVTWLYPFFFFPGKFFFRCSLQLSNFCIAYGLGCYLSMVSP